KNELANSTFQTTTHLYLTQILYPPSPQVSQKNHPSSFYSSLPSVIAEKFFLEDLLSFVAFPLSLSHSNISFLLIVFLFFLFQSYIPQFGHLIRLNYSVCNGYVYNFLNRLATLLKSLFASFR